MTPRTHEPDPDDALLDTLLNVLGDRRGGPPTLWFLVLDDHDRALPVALPVEHAPQRPSEAVAAHLVLVLTSVVAHEAPGGSVLVGYVHESGGVDGAFERGWSRVLRLHASTAGLRIRAEVAVGAHHAGVLRAPATD
ncbi:hypothetical protein ACGIF2_01075 [Cellulomonas sp. P22]|uniref:hypothetical protein n=1 Tax=Cellulomonas sp. P22 TaxID=3373189 RepID=UPI00379AF755